MSDPAKLTPEIVEEIFAAPSPYYAHTTELPETVKAAGLAFAALLRTLDDAIVIRRVDGEWPEWVVDRLLGWFYDHDGTPLVPDSRLTYIEHALDALADARPDQEVP